MRQAGGGAQASRSLPPHLPACRTLATSLPCEAISLMTAASSASTVGTSSSYCQWPLWSQVSPGAGREDGSAWQSL